jgi:hypothetical protein
MAFKSLLLDVNGVVLRDPDLLHHMRENHIAYVASKVPSSKNPSKTERLLRVGFKGTANGLREVYGVDTSDFLEKVYDKHLMSRLTETLYGTEFQRDAKCIYDIAKGHDWKVTLISNAPSVWVSPIAEAIGDVYSCPKDGVVLPEHHVQVYVDDSVRRINTKCGLPNWSPILFTDSKKQGTWYKQMSSFEEIAMYIRSLDMWTEYDHWHKTEY